MNNLAIILSLQRTHREATDMGRRGLERREKILGPEHPMTLSSMSSLVVVLQEQREYQEAKEICRRALEGREKMLGLEHPDTLQSLYLLATLTPF